MAKRLIPTVSPDELAFATGVAFAAAAKKGPYRNPARLGMSDDEPDIEAPSGALLTSHNGFLRVTDNPLSRAAFAIFEQFGSGEKSRALLMRFHAITDLFRDERIKPYVQEPTGKDEPQLYRKEIIEVAATEELTEDKGFNKQRFFRKLKARVAETDRNNGT